MDLSLIGLITLYIFGSHEDKTYHNILLLFHVTLCQGTKENSPMKYHTHVWYLRYPVTLKSAFTVNVSCTYYHNWELTVCTYVCMYVHIYVHPGIHVHAYVCNCVCNYVCMYSGCTILTPCICCFLVPIDTYMVLCSFYCRSSVRDAINCLMSWNYRLQHIRYVHNWSCMARSLLFVVIEKRSGYLSVEMLCCKTHRFCLLLTNHWRAEKRC